jgi:hypothetical protein
MQPRSSRFGIQPVVGFALLLAAYGGMTAYVGRASAAVSPRVLWVANDGVDSIHCGAKTDQCRSISQAIENASDGDTINVGLGRYGDLNDDEDFDDPGEEHARLIPGGGGCIVCIDKAVHVFSLHGPDVTIIDGGTGIFGAIAVVDIGAAGAIFGTAGKGFTVTGGYFGIAAEGGKAGGNIVLKSEWANFFYSLLSAGPLVLEDNTAVAGHLYGFYDGASFGVPPVTLQRNLAIANNSLGMSSGGNGKLVANNVAILNGGIGIDVGAGGTYVEDNVAVANYIGIAVGGAEEFTHDTVKAVRRNTIVGNRLVGLSVSGPVTAGAHDNNIFGNGAQPFPQGPPEAGLPGIFNCGVLNTSGKLLQASANFWGSPTGPGPDPADEAGGKCDLYGSSTVTKPAATAPTGIATE